MEVGGQLGFKQSCGLLAGGCYGGDYLGDGVGAFVGFGKEAVGGDGDGGKRVETFARRDVIAGRGGEYLPGQFGLSPETVPYPRLLRVHFALQVQQPVVTAHAMDYQRLSHRLAQLNLPP